MANDSPANEVHRRAPGRGAIERCLVAASILVGLVLLPAGLFALFLAATGEFKARTWAAAIVAILGGLAFIAGAVRIMGATRRYGASGPPLAAASEPAPPPQDIRDIGGTLIVLGLVLLLIFAFLVTQVP